MIDYAAIADAVPATELAAANTELGTYRTLIVNQLDELGNMVPTVLEDENGDAIQVNGKFMDDTTVVAAFNAIKDLPGDTVSKGVHKQTYVSLSAEIGVGLTAQLESAVESAIAIGDLSVWVGKALNGNGINVNDAQVAGVLGSLVGTHGFDQDLVDAIVATGVTTNLKFPNLKVGHVQTALQKRYKGEV
jgi:hypothetical protein